MSDPSTPARESESGDSSLLLSRRLTPMEAANALYSESSGAVAEAIVASLRQQVFDAELPKPSTGIRRSLAKLVLRILKRTTRAETQTAADGREVLVYRNRILERSNHPYASTLLRPSDMESASFVEGGDAMNAPYMMLSPEIRKNAATWDRIFLDSVLGRDVQLRFVWETRITHEIATRRLNEGEPVRLKAAAAGTGLSMILVYDRLIRDGHDPKQISATITDRAAANVAKTQQLLSKLATTRDNFAKGATSSGISAQVEDLFELDSNGDDRPHIVTLVGILEYFHGFTHTTTEEYHGLAAEAEEKNAQDVLRKIGEMTAESGTLIANSYRTEMGARLLEVFGKRIRYRNREHVQALVETAGFVPTGRVGSGIVYDVEAFEKRPSQESAAQTNDVET